MYNPVQLYHPNIIPHLFYSANEFNNNARMVITILISILLYAYSIEKSCCYLYSQLMKTLHEATTFFDSIYMF